MTLAYFAAFTLTLWAFAHGGLTKPTEVSSGESVLQMGIVEAMEVATVSGSGAGGDRSANLKYVKAIRSSSIWAAVKQRALTVSTTDARTADIVNATPDSLSDDDLAALRRACHDGLKCVAVDQLLVLKSSTAVAAIAEKIGGHDEALARRAITKITRVLTRYTDEYHEESTYVEVTESDEPSAICRSVMVILTDNKELCRLEPHQRRATEPAMTDAGTQTSGTKTSGSKTSGPETSDSKTSGPNTSDPETPGQRPQEPLFINNGTVNYGTINNVNINTGTVNSATVSGQTPLDYIQMGSDAQGTDRTPPAAPAEPARARTPKPVAASDRAPANRSGPGAKRPAAADRQPDDKKNAAGDDNGDDGQKNATPADGAVKNGRKVEAENGGDDLDAGIGSVGLENVNAVHNGHVEDGVVNNGRLNMRDVNEGVYNKGIVNRTSAKDGIVNVGTLNNGPTYYAAANRPAGDQDDYVKQYVADVDDMFSSVIKELAD